MKKFIVVFFLIGLVPKYKAQDAHLSMYDAAPLFLNSGMTGVFEGKWRVHAQYRTQWKSVNFKPYTSALVSFDMPVRKWGFGVQLHNFRAGYGNFNVLQGLVSAAYNMSLDKRRYNNLSFGIQAGAMQKSVEYQLLSFNNQYSLNNGGEFNTTLVSGETFGAQSMIVPVANASLLYYYARQQSKLNPFVGISAFNLLQPNESFYLLPKVLVMQQEKFNEQTFALEAGYFLKGSETYLLGGLIYRAKDAAIATFGVKKENFIVKLGYDVNVSSLTTVSTGRGGFELSFTYVNGKNKPKVDKICPRL